MAGPGRQRDFTLLEILEPVLDLGNARNLAGRVVEHTVEHMMGDADP